MTKFIYRLTQPIHERLGKQGLLFGDTKCYERGCDKYHGNSPSGLFMFYAKKHFE